MISHWFPNEFPLISNWFPTDFPLISHWYPNDFLFNPPWKTHGTSRKSIEPKRSTIACPKIRPAGGVFIQWFDDWMSGSSITGWLKSSNVQLITNWCPIDGKVMGNHHHSMTFPSLSHGQHQTSVNFFMHLSVSSVVYGRMWYGLSLICVGETIFSTAMWLYFHQ